MNSTEKHKWYLKVSLLSVVSKIDLKRIILKELFDKLLRYGLKQIFPNSSLKMSSGIPFSQFLIDKP